MVYGTPRYVAELLHFEDRQIGHVLQTDPLCDAICDQRLRQLIRNDCIDQEQLVDSFHRFLYGNGIKQIADGHLNACWQLMIGVWCTNQRTDFCAALREIPGHQRALISRCTSDQNFHIFFALSQWFSSGCCL